MRTRLASLVCFLLLTAVFGWSWLGRSKADFAPDGDGERTAGSGVAPPPHSPVVERVDRGEVAQSPSDEANGPVKGSVVLRVVTQADTPVAGVGVHVSADRTPLGSTDADGLLRCELSPGRHVFRVDPESLPDGILAPALQHNPHPGYEVPAGYFASAVSVEPGQVSEVTVRLFRGAEVLGVVTDVDGVPVVGCPVRLQSVAAGLSALCYDVDTEVDGVYRFAGIAPGRYTVCAYSSAAKPRSIAPNPVPFRISVEEGVRTNLPVAVCGDRRAIVTGRLCGDDGSGIGDVEIVAYPSSQDLPEGERRFGLNTVIALARTAADGTFELAVPPASIKVQAHPEGCQLPMGAPKRLRKPMQPVTVQAVVGRNDLGVLVGELSHAFTLQLTLHDNVDAIRAQHPRASTNPASAYVVPASGMSDRARWKRLDVREEVAFWKCEKPDEPLMLIVQRPYFGELVRQIDVDQDRVSLEITYP